MASSFYANMLLSTGGTPHWFVTQFDYQDIIQANCIIAGLTCALMLGINRDLNLEVNLAAKRHAQQLEKQVQTIENARNELKAISAQLTETKNHLNNQLILENQNQERLNQAHEQLEQFALAASHDLKEPIRTIRLYTQLVQKRLPEELKDDGILKEHFQFITGSCKHMYAALEKLLVYQRVSYNEDVSVELSVSKLWNQQLLRATKDLRAIALKHTPANQAKLTHLDNFMLSLTAQNELSNAENSNVQDLIKVPLKNAETMFYEIATNALLFRSWESEILVDLTTEIIQDNVLKVSISDNGIGIEEPYFEQVFGMFKRIHPREKYPGVGLGLPIVRRIVSHANGTVVLKHADRQGTKVVIELPRHISST